MRNAIRVFHTSGQESEGGGGSTASLFEQLCSDKKKALDSTNRANLSNNLKLRFHGAINNAKGNIAAHQGRINDELGRLGEMDFNAILASEAGIVAEERTINAAKKYYKVLFGTALVEQAL